VSEWTVQRLQDTAAVIQRLESRQLSGDAAREKAKLFARAAQTLDVAGVAPSEPAVACYVPGRIEVLGKHTDYGGGRSLVCAVERGFCLAAAARPDQLVEVTDAVSGQSAEFRLAPETVPTAGDWSNYPMTVARRVARNFPGPLRGAQMAFASDLPLAAGMSSSSALIVATFLAISAINDLPERDVYKQNILRPEDLAGYLGTVENGQGFGSLAGDLGVGTFGGSEDHTAILCARSGEISQYSYCPVQFERVVSMPEDHVFVVAVSGVVAEKTGEAREQYNRVSQLAAAIVKLWNDATGQDAPHMAAIIRSAADAPDRLRQVLKKLRHATFGAGELLDRFEQFLAESEQIIPAVPECLATPADIEYFGTLADRSQTRGAQLLKNQVPETIFLADTARQLGAAASSAFGAGFGGSVWALVREDDAADLSAKWSAAYRQRFPQLANQAALLTTRAGPATFFLNDDT
jgi:galactokinase